MSKHDPRHWIYFEGIPLVTNPTFDNLDILDDAFRVGDVWRTAGFNEVQVIARHADGDFEVTVKVMRQFFHPSDERRGTRVGSSYIVDRNGKVKRGHLAPPQDMNLNHPVPKVTGKSAHTMVMDETPQMAVFSKLSGQSFAAEVKVGPNPAEVALAHAMGFDVPKTPAKVGWLRDAIFDVASKQVDAMQSVLTTAMRGEMDAKITNALKAYHDQQPKFSVGKTYVTRNGSQVEVVKIADNLITGKIVRGGDSHHKWGGGYAWFLTGRKNQNSTGQMDLIHEVLP